MASGIRGCGYRIKGATYVECRLSPFGQPLDNFLIDSPQVLDTNALGIRPRGMTPVLRDDTTHLFDWIGADGYPNVADFIEEARHKGISRRVLPSLVDDLSPDSRLLLIHPRAHVHNALDFWRALFASGRIGDVRCPLITRGEDSHVDTVLPWLESPDDLPQPWCLGACYHDLIGQKVGGEAPGKSNHPDIVKATVGDLSYQGWARPAMDVSVQYKPALFMAVPISCVTVINDPDDQARTNALFGKVRDILKDIPVFLEDA